MNIVCISDTHNQHQELHIPLGDVLIHAGDMTETGSKQELASFFKWFANLPHKHKICIAGNHDFYLENLTKEELFQLIPNNIKYLHNNSVEIGGYRFWGSPYISGNFPWAFCINTKQIKACWDKIPQNTDVIITHSPPYDILDQTNKQIAIGCPFLKKKVESIAPTYHIFGHTHDNYGKVKLGETTFINATSFNSSRHFKNKTISVEL